MSRIPALTAMTVPALASAAAIAQQPLIQPVDSKTHAASAASSVNPLIGSSRGGRTFAGPIQPFGMLPWRPQTTCGKYNRTAAPGGDLYRATRILGFSLTHLSGAGASGDIPFMPITALNRARPPSRTLYYPFPEPLDEI